MVESTAAVVTARGLRKEFGDFVAVDGVDFQVAPGESFGFLGPNGAVCRRSAVDRCRSSDSIHIEMGGKSAAGSAWCRRPISWTAS